MQVGDVVDGRYRLLDLLGEGAAGKVFRCEDLGKNNMFVALKLLHAKDPRWENFFRREFEVLSRVHHPNLVSVYDFGPAPEENTWYFTQELVVGKPLLETVAGKKIDEVIALFVEICRALEFIHGHGVLHRDLKPANILVQQHAAPGERVRVLDFGLWRELDNTPQRGARWAGTPPYLASEVLRGFGHSISADLYAVGITLFQVLTRKLPHGRGTPPELLQARKVPAPDLTGMVKPEFAQLITRLLDELPENRPQSAAELAASLSQLIPDHAVAMPLALGRARLVGRDVERQQMADIIEAVREKRADRPHLVVIEGLDGIGKSRFVNEMKAEAQLKGGRSAIGLCMEDVRLTYRPIADLARALAPLAGRAQLTQSEKHVLSRLLPDLAGPPHVIAPPLSTKHDRDRFHEAAADLFLGLGGASVCVLVVEDVTFCDPASAALLATLIARAKESSVLVVVTLSSEHGSAPVEILQASSNTVHVMLQPLPKQDVHKLLCGLLGVSVVPEALTEMLTAHSRGSPLMVEELLALMIDRGDLPRGEYGWDLASWKSQGASVALLSVLAERLQRLNNSERSALCALAVFNRPSGPKVLAAIAGIDVEIVRQALSGAEGHGLIRVVGEEDGRPRFIFRHPNIKDALLRSLQEQGKLAAWHRTCAQVLEKNANDNLPAMAETLAHHYENGGDRGRALELFLVASRHALATFGFEDALSLARRAGRLAAKDNAEAATFMQCDLVAGRAMLNAGHTADARAFLEGAIARPNAAAAPDDYAEMHTWLARACVTLGTSDVGLKAVEQALVVLDANTTPSAVARLLVARGELTTRTNPKLALTDAQQAMRLWGGKPDNEDAYRVGELIAVAALLAGDPHGAVAAATQWVALAQKQARILEEIPARRRLAEALSAIGDRLQARQELSTALTLAIDSGHRAEEASVTGALAHELFLSGAYSESIARYQNAATLSAQMGQIMDRALCLKSIGRCYLFKGEYDRALDHLRAALDAFDRQGDLGNSIAARCDVALAFLAKGNTDEAHEALKAASKRLPPQGLDQARAETYAAQGALFTARSDFKRARIAFLNSAAIYRRVKDRMALGGVVVGYAQLLLRVGEPQRAFRLCRRAETTFSDLDARGELKRLQPLLNAAHGLSQKRAGHSRIALR